MAYEIIPENKYLSPGSTHYLTPTWFNQIFSNINSRSMSNGRFVRPVQVASDVKIILWKTNDDGVYLDDKTSPQSINLKELGQAFVPDGWSTISTTWTMDANAGTHMYTVSSSTDASAVLTLNAGSCDAGGHTNEPDCTGSGNSWTAGFDPSTISSLLLNCSVVYEDPEGDQITTSSDFAIPVLEVNDGKAAIVDPVPLINIATTHEPLTTPGGSAYFKAHSASWLPQTGTFTNTWSLSLNGVDKTSYLTPTNGGLGCDINIPEVAKGFELTLTITDGLGTTFTVTALLSTYDYGSFLFSSWGNSVPVVSPKVVTLTASNISTFSENKIFPGAGGTMKVKWGDDLSELSRKNGGNTTNDMLAIPGFSTDGTKSGIVQSAMNEFGLPSTENVQNYSLIEVNDNGKDLVGDKFYANNMSGYAEIKFKVTNVSLAGLGGLSIANNSLYLVKGIVPDGVLESCSIGPGAERYYVHLKHYEIGSDGTYQHSGQYDQFATVVQSTLAAPVDVVFNDIPIGAKFQAEVIAANGSAYSAAKKSEGLTSMTSIQTNPIATVTGTPTQYGLALSVALTPGVDPPIGYIASYIEMDANVAWPNTISIPAGKDAMFASSSAVYSPANIIKIPASIGQKVAVSVYSVMADGSVTTPVDLDPISVNVPWSYLETGLSKSLGRVVIDNLIEDSTSIIDNSTAQQNICITSFGRDVFLESVIFWVHDLTIGTGDEITLRIQSDAQADANDEKIATLSETNIDAAPGLKYAITNLSIPIPAGQDLLVAAQGFTDNSNDSLDVSIDLHYSNGTIVTSSTPIPDEDGANQGGNPL